MNELVQIVMQKTGIRQEQATSAVNAVTEYMKGKLPAHLTEHINTLMADVQGLESSGLLDRAKGVAAGITGAFGEKDA
ncbi:MAG: hypothetical protein WA879_12120 [Candidatus Acidiferrales bacterium]